MSGSRNSGVSSGSLGPRSSPQRITRRRFLAGVGTVWAGGMLYLLFGRPQETVRVEHWANNHVMNKSLLPLFAGQFNSAGHYTRSGKRIEVNPVGVNSGEMVRDLTARVTTGASLNGALPNPTVVTPAASHWLHTLNSGASRSVVDLDQTLDIARSWVGIVTYREMAECLGWPEREVGVADVVALCQNPEGWAAYKGARTSWGKHPLMSFTDPSSSSSACSMLYSLYCIAANKTPDQLTGADVANPSVIEYVRSFQRAVDHYVPDTLILNSKIYLGPRYGHFFFIPENNLVQLYQGKQAVTVGAESKPEPLQQEMVFIYPKEGATAHNHAAAVVKAPWVSSEQEDAAQQWVDFLRQDAQQQGFMREGLRPATAIPLDETIGPKYRLDPAKPRHVINPDNIDPTVTRAIVNNWGEVKKPGIVTFVVDLSGSMSGNKLEQAKKGLLLAVDALADNCFVGLVTFADTIGARIEVAAKQDNGFAIADAVQEMKASGNTALYDAIKVGIEMTDAAEGDEDAIRGVVVLSDGLANRGNTGLDEIVQMMSRDETRICSFRGLDGNQPMDCSQRWLLKSDVIGTELKLNTKRPIHVFFVGIGDADWDVCRILAEATGSACQGTKEADLSKVMSTFGKYF